jgi:uncharacterized protein YqeY
MTWVERFQSDLVRSMKGKDRLKTGVLRMMKTAMKNREIEKRADLTDEEVYQTLKTLVKQRKEAIEQYRAGGRHELAEKEQQEIEILEDYLPEAISDEEMICVVSAVAAEMGAEGPKDMGKVMKESMARMSATGKTVDGKIVSALVREKLQALEK